MKLFLSDFNESSCFTFNIQSGKPDRSFQRLLLSNFRLRLKKKNKKNNKKNNPHLNFHRREGTRGLKFGTQTKGRGQKKN